MNWIKRLFCKHEHAFVRNIWGDEIIACGYKRSLWKCKRCGKYQLRDKLMPQGFGEPQEPK